MSTSTPITINISRDKLESELTQTEKEYAAEQNLDPVEIYKADTMDYSNLTKYNFTSSKCPITDFNIQKPTIQTFTKEQLAAKYYQYVESNPKTNLLNKFKLELPVKTENDMIKPTNAKIVFNGTDSKPQFDYISVFNNPDANWKILNHITSAISHFNFIDSTNPELPVYQSLCSLQDSELLSSHDLDKPKTSTDLFSSYGLYGLHNNMTTSTVHNFKSSINDFIYQTIDRKFNKSNKFSSQAEYYSLFNSLFTSDSKLKSSLVSSLILPNIINNIDDKIDLYSKVPHAEKNTLFSNFNDPKNPCNENIFGVNYIPSFYTSKSLQTTFSTDNLSAWNYPFVQSTVDASGNLNPNSTTGRINENLNLQSNFIIRDISQNSAVVFDDLHQYSLNKNYMNDKYLLEKPTTTTSQIDVPVIKSAENYKRLYHSIVVEKVGTMTYNPKEKGAYCKGCSRKYGSGHGDKYSVDVYKLIHRDENGKLLNEEDNIGKRNAPETPKFECGDAIKEISPDWMKKYDDNDSNRTSEKKYTCCKKQNNQSKWCIVHNFGDPKIIADNVKSKLREWGVKTELSIDSISGSSIDSLNDSLKSLKPYREIQVAPFSKIDGKNTYYYKFGNGLSAEEINMLKLSSTYATKKQDAIKTYSATFGALTTNVSIYDDRFFYILYKYYMTNKNMLCDILESEILKYFIKHPELLAIYRIQKGYLQYALTKLTTLSPTSNLSVIQFDSQDKETKEKIHAVDNNISCFMNVETPIIGAMVHSNTLNMTDYNDYVSDSLTKFKVKDFTTNDGKVIALDMDSLKYMNVNNLDSIYQNSIRKFGNISANNLTLPGIFISDSGVPNDFIDGSNNTIMFVDVEGKNAQATLDQISQINAGTLIVFNFETIGSFQKTGWSDNPELNKAISTAGSQNLMNFELPYVMLIKEVKKSESNVNKIEYLFEYSTFRSNTNENGIKVLYYRESENKSDGNTYLSRDSLVSDNVFKFVKNYCGVFDQTHPFGRLITNYNVMKY